MKKVIILLILLQIFVLTSCGKPAVNSVSSSVSVKDPGVLGDLIIKDDRKNVILNSYDITDPAQVRSDEGNPGEYVVNLFVTDEAGEKLLDYAEQLASQEVSVFVNNKIACKVRIDNAVKDGMFVISAKLNEQQAADIAYGINTGSSQGLY